MEAIILGSGGAVPRPDRTPCAVLVMAAGLNLILDLGSGVLHRLAQEGVDYDDLDAILITHYHMDHTLDLWAYFFAAQMPGFTARGQVTFIAPEGFETLQAGLEAAYGHWAVAPPGLLDVHLIDPNAFHSLQPAPGLEVKTAPANHKPESVAYRVEADGKSLVYTGDTDYSESIVELAQGAELLIAECSMPEDFKKDGHLIPSLAGRMAAAAGVERLVLTHLYPETDGCDLITPARKEFGGEILVAEDGLRLKV